MTEQPIKKCVHCRGKVERLIGSGAGLIFKGSGFYATDYKKPMAGEAKQRTEEVKKKPEDKAQKSDGKK